jgi:deaminated glutathione amidase
MYLAACIQLRSTADVERNVAEAERLIRRAVGYGASLVVTPECTVYLGPWEEKARVAESVDGPIATHLAGLARSLGIHLLIGSFPERATLPDGSPDPVRSYNTSLLFGPDGSLLCSYRKIHLFDVDVPGGVTLQESRTTIAGDAVVTCDTPLGKLGLSICYDLRFPELYRALVDQGAEVITIPAAFTLDTGKDHWHALVRARAIETQAWVLAPGQWGRHGDRGIRRSYGHSLIVDPWGTVVAECGDGEGICLAEIQRARTREIRRGMPVAEHRVL